MRGPGFKSGPDTEGGPVTTITWGAEPARLNISLEVNPVSEGSQGTLPYLTVYIHVLKKKNYGQICFYFNQS